MGKLPYIIIGVLAVFAIISVALNNNKTDPLENLTQAPTSTVQNPPSPTSTEVLGQETEIPQVSTATVITSKGEIVIELFSDAAPSTVTNFANKAQNNFYNNLTFHRVEGWVVQGGDPLGNGTGGGQMATELNNNPFIRGSVGIARGGDINISNDSQFFITKTDAPHLDQQYTNFGQVAEGMDVVDSIEIGDQIISITVN